MIIDEYLELCWIDFLDNDMNIVWWGECIDVDNLMIMENNLALEGLAISIWKVLLLLENGILGRVSSMPKLHLTKVA